MISLEAFLRDNLYSHFRFNLAAQGDYHGWLSLSGWLHLGGLAAQRQPIRIIKVPIRGFPPKGAQGQRRISAEGTSGSARLGSNHECLPQLPQRTFEEDVR